MARRCSVGARRAWRGSGNGTRVRACGVVRRRWHFLGEVQAATSDLAGGIIGILHVVNPCDGVMGPATGGSTGPR